MKQSTRKKADEIHANNQEQIRRLIEKFKDPNTPDEEKDRIKEKFKKIIAHADKIESEQSDSMFLKIFGKPNGKVD